MNEKVLMDHMSFADNTVHTLSSVVYEVEPEKKKI